MRAFAPSFVNSTVEPFETLCQSAYDAVVDETSLRSVFAAIDLAPEDKSFTLAGYIESAATWFQFGHFNQDGSDRSGVCPFSVTFVFTANTLQSVEIRLFVLNPRFLFAERGFAPASISATSAYAVTSAGLHIGLSLVRTKSSTGSSDKADIFNELKAGVPELSYTPGGWTPYDQSTLLARIDVAMSWTAVNGQFSTDVAGKAKNNTVASITGGSVGTRLKLYSFGSPLAYNALIHESERFGLNLESGDGVDAVIVLGDHSGIKGSDAAKLKTAMLEFGLQKNFRGVLFNNIAAHWLDDSSIGADIVATSAARAAVSFHEKASAIIPARLYATVACEVNPTKNDSYLKFLKSGARFSLTLAGHIVRACSLSATFANMDAGDIHPYTWLAGRKVTIILNSVAVNNLGGGTSDEYSLDLTFDADSKSTPLITYTAADLNLSSEEFTYLASVLTLAPIFKLAGKVGARPNDNNKRVRFVDVSSDAALGAVFTSAAFTRSWFFKNAVHASEFRVTGARILTQPTGVHSRDTAILFDVETEFSVYEKDLGLSSTRALAVRVENTGMLYTNGRYRWVQMLGGAFKVDVLDSSVWELGGLAGLLKVKNIGLKFDLVPTLDLTVGMSLNLGVVTAEDFKISFDLLDVRKNLQIYPSKITVNLKGVLEGQGEISFGRGKEFFKDISGKLDLKFASGLRMSAAARVAHFQEKEKGSKTAFAAGAKVEFATAIPLPTSGLGIKGFQAIYASHFRRAEKPEQYGIPPSLQWLKDAKGEIAIDSIFDKALWKTEYDKWSYGVGMLLVLQGNDEVINLNAMLVLDVPGPTITLFAKLNILEEVATNKEQADANKLTTGMLAILQIDVPNKTISLGALVEYELEFVKIYAALGSKYSLNDLSDWYFYVGHYNRPVTAIIKLGDILNAGAEGYFMAAGNIIPSVPRGSGGEVDLPGLALALGAAAYARLGSGGLYLSMELQAFLDISIGKDIYAAGGMEISGELFLFIAGIGASSSLSFEFYSGDPGTYLEIRGDVCGRIKVGFLKLRGCVSATIGSKVPTQISIASLVTKVSVVAGTNVALLGQGATGGIDSSLATIESGDAFAKVGQVPLDAVLAISLTAAPATAGAGGFLDQLGPSAATTVFNYGKKRGGYSLTDVSLRKLNDGGGLDEIDYGASSAVWWRSTQKPGNQQPLAIDLALLTRRPFAAQNVVPEDTMQRWIDALTGEVGVCDVVPPQVEVATMPVDAEEVIDPIAKRMTWQLTGYFQDAHTESLLFPARPDTVSLSVLQRHDYGSPTDRFAAYPRFLARKVVETYPNMPGRSFAFLSVMSLPLAQDAEPTTLLFACEAFAEPDRGQPQSRFIELLVATTLPLDDNDLRVECGVAGSALLSTFAVDPMTDGSDYHNGLSGWALATGGFLSLSGRTGYGDLLFYRILVDLKSPWSQSDPPVWVRLTWPTSPKFDHQKMLVGGIKFLSTDELERVTNQTAYNGAVLGELEAYLRAPMIPILEPNSKYELTTRWNTVGDDIVPGGKMDIFRFSTTSDPPRRLDPYLLATLPAAEEQIHPYGHMLGFSLSSGDVLRILQKHPGLRLRISVTEDGDNRVVGSDAQGNAIVWSDGLLFDPAQLLDVIADIPSIDRTWFNALPSPLLRALKQAIAQGKLHCLDNTIKLDQGLWIGLRATLQPLLGYRVRVELVDAVGAPWTFQETARDDEGLPFLEWHFRTGVHADLAEHAEALKRPVMRSRRIRAKTDAPPHDLDLELTQISRLVSVSDEYRDPDLSGVTPPAIADEVFLAPDQAMEDLLNSWLGERTPMTTEVETSALWEVDKLTAKAAAIVVRSREPLLRRTRTARIVKDSTDAGSAEILKLDDIITRYPSLKTSSGISKLYSNSSGTCTIALLDAAFKGTVVLRANEYAAHYLPYDSPVGPHDLLAISSGKLQR